MYDLCGPMDCSPPGSSVRGIFQRILEWVCHFLLRGIFLTQESNPCLLHWQADSLPLNPQWSPELHLPLLYSYSLSSHFSSFLKLWNVSGMQNSTEENIVNTAITVNPQSSFRKKMLQIQWNLPPWLPLLSPFIPLFCLHPCPLFPFSPALLLLQLPLHPFPNSLALSLLHPSSSSFPPSPFLSLQSLLILPCIFKKSL